MKKMGLTLLTHMHFFQRLCLHRRLQSGAAFWRRSELLKKVHVGQLILCAALLALCSTRLVSAGETKANTTGFTISPALQEIILQKDQQSLTDYFTLANNGDKPETFEVSAIDMGTLDETGGLIFSGFSQDYQRKYGLAQWVTLEHSVLTVPPHNVGKVGFTIKNEASLSPGGHYGAIIVRQASTQSSPEQRVTLTPQAASLLFLRKVGGEVYKLSLPEIEANYNLWQLPTKVSLPFKNEGNIHLVPRGIVRVKDSLGREITKGIINPESALILPERSRVFKVALDTKGRTPWPGRYIIEVDYRYDGQETFTQVSHAFYTAHLRTLVLLVSLVIVGGLALFIFWKRKIWRRLRLPRFRRRKYR